MIAHSAFVAAIALVVLTGTLAQQLLFLAPYKRVLWHEYGATIGVAMAVLFVNLWAAAYLVVRRLLLTETGRKLAHVEKQLQAGDTILRDLSERLAAEE
jgi:di/tricarboxylate transporter